MDDEKLLDGSGGKRRSFRKQKSTDEVGPQTFQGCRNSDTGTGLGTDTDIGLVMVVVFTKDNCAKLSEAFQNI